MRVVRCALVQTARVQTCRRGAPCQRRSLEGAWNAAQSRLAAVGGGRAAGGGRREAREGEAEGGRVRRRSRRAWRSGGRPLGTGGARAVCPRLAARGGGSRRAGGQRAWSTLAKRPTKCCPPGTRGSCRSTSALAATGRPVHAHVRVTRRGHRLCSRGLQGRAAAARERASFGSRCQQLRGETRVGLLAARLRTVPGSVAAAKVAGITLFESSGGSGQPLQRASRQLD